MKAELNVEFELEKELARRLQGDGHWSAERIGAALEGMKEQVARLAGPHIAEPDGAPYGRKVVFANDRLEAIVIHLPPGAATAVHDHGVSVGCAIVAEGRMTNEEYRFGEDGALRLEAARKHERGQLAPSPAGIIHRMRNDEAQRLVSLHVYAPPLRGMNRYDV